MKVHVEGILREDPRLRGVTRLLALGGERALIRDLLAGLPDIGEYPSEAWVRAVKQRPGQRALLEVMLNWRAGVPAGEGVPGSNQARGDARTSSVTSRRRWFVKCVRSRSQLSAERLDLMRAVSVRAAGTGISVPPPVAILSRFRAVAYEAAEGLPLLTLIRARRDPTPDNWPSHLGRATAALHRALAESPLPFAPGAETGRTIAEELAAAFARVRTHRPELIERFEAAASDVLADLERGMPATRVDRGLKWAIHGDFHPAQVLIGPEREDGGVFTVLDWDCLRLGEPEQDLANFVAHLDLEATRGALPKTDGTVLGESFLAGYAAVRATDSERIAAHRRATLIRLAALHADPEFGALPPNPTRLAEDLLALAVPHDS